MNVDNTGAYAVYRYVEDGITRYVGITNNLTRGAYEHMLQHGWRIEPMYGLETLSRFDARAVEQVLIDQYQLSDLYNLINSISLTNPAYHLYIARGREILESFNYFQ